MPRSDQAEISWIVAISSLGFMVGSLVSRFTSDKYGRRATLLASVLPLGIGVVSTIYLAEISDKDLRGRLILGNRFMFSFGCMVTMAVGPFVDYQTINYSLVLLPICYFSACWWIPETPYFLLKEGKVDAARETLARLTSIRDEEVGIMLATVISVLGFESVVYMLPAELFPLNIKSVAMTAVNIYGGLLNFISVKSYQQIKDLGGLSAVFWVFATATLSGAVFSMFFVPETKCKSLRQIQIELQGNIYDECSEEMQPAVSTIYLAEISDKDLRGRLILGNRFMFSFGCMVTMAVGPFVDYQTINYSLVLLPICYFSACWWIPETPYFLLKEGKVDAARETKAIVSDGIGCEEGDDAIRNSTKVTQLMAGIHAIQQYLGPIINESKSGMNTSTALIIFGVVRFTIGILSFLLVDRLGRRPLIIYSYFGSGLCLAIVGAYFFIGVKPSSSTLNPYGFIPFVGIILATVISVLGFLSIVYMLQAELFPLNIKSVAMTAVNIYSGLLNFISVKSYQQIKDLGGMSAVFWVFATATISGAVFSIYFVPETKCKSLRQIQIELQGNIYDECGEEMQPAVLNNNEKKQDVSEDNELKAIIEKKDEV
ncbi:Facilitated trehalose transporter Tret1 [Operophtera brumata]|uniref:Facilitated trehalose transporter Tret1 n=1 Tax=Operophtera brumata TaxID=104452 RepID=A0A0L7L6Z3_OPEBR|nr:Facilitated trehalose transporter Tret1 [Operophtera brumata]